MTRPAFTYRATIRTSTAGLAEFWAGAGILPSTTPFQSLAWTQHWYNGFSDADGSEALLVEVTEVESGALAYLLPLIRRREAGRVQIEFADRGVSDYNLPILGPAAPIETGNCRAAWQAVSSILPQADLCVFVKMPAAIGARSNPLVVALGGAQSHLIGSHIEMPDDYDAWLGGVGRHNRKEFGRFWRVFTRAEGARLVKASSVDEAMRILNWIEARQSERAAEMGLGSDEYRLDIPHFKQFYRDLVRDGIESGTTIVTALMAGDEIVAALFAVSDGAHYAMVRIAVADGEWANCSPGRLVIERSINALHAEGYRWFDFTTGDYAYKRTFRTVHVALFDVTLARSMRGLPQAGLARTKAFVKRRPMLERFARRLMAIGKPAQAADKQDQLAG